MWRPGAFVPRHYSAFETSNPFRLDGPQAILLIGVFVPESFIASAFIEKHQAFGFLCAICYLPLLWLSLVEFHKMGVVRFWLSAPLALLVHAAITLAFGGLI